MSDSESTAATSPTGDTSSTPETGVPSPTPGQAPKVESPPLPPLAENGRSAAEPTRKVPLLSEGGPPAPTTSSGPSGAPPVDAPTGDTTDGEELPVPPPIRPSTGPVGYPPKPDGVARRGPTAQGYAPMPDVVPSPHPLDGGPIPTPGRAADRYGDEDLALDAGRDESLFDGQATVTPPLVREDDHHTIIDLDGDRDDEDSILGPIEQFDVENAVDYDDDEDGTRSGFSGRRLAAVGAVFLLIGAGIAFVANISRGGDDGGDGPSVDLLAQATVQIVGLDPDGNGLCSGSGTFVSTQGMILTNAHVVTRDSVCDFDSLGIAVTSDSGRPPDLLYGAELLAVDNDLDLAVLMVGEPLDDGAVGMSEFPAMTLGDSDELMIGDDLRILGYPEIGGETITFTNGSVSGFTAQAGIGDRALIKTDATIAGGNSGGAAVDNDGSLIGIPTKARASESGPAVDCRPLADTNNDGQVDEADNCVPIGGFLNGLRPINLAKPLIDRAGSANPQVLEPAKPDVEVDLDTVVMSRPRFSLGEADNAPVEVVRSAIGGIEELCLFVDWEGIPDGAEWDGLWYLDKELVEDFSLVGQTWDFGSVGNNFWMCAIDGDDGLDPGLYELGFFLAGELVFAEGIVVTAEPVPVFATTWENTTDVDICGLAVNPLGSGPAGLNELEPSAVIPPGDTVTLDLAAGDAVVEAYDCGGEVVADSGGGALQIVEDRIYTIEAPAGPETSADGTGATEEPDADGDADTANAEDGADQEATDTADG